MMYFFDQPVRFVENTFVDVDVLTGFVAKDGFQAGYRTDYSDVEELVDRKYWQPSSVAVSQVGKHASQVKLMYDAPDLLKRSDVSAINASIRHPSNDIVDTVRQMQTLKKITIEVAEADVKAQLEKIEAERKALEKKQSVPNEPSTPPNVTLGG